MAPVGVRHAAQISFRIILSYSLIYMYFVIIFPQNKIWLMFICLYEWFCFYSLPTHPLPIALSFSISYFYFFLLSVFVSFSLPSDNHINSVIFVNSGVRYFFLSLKSLLIPVLSLSTFPFMKLFSHPTPPPFKFSFFIHLELLILQEINILTCNYWNIWHCKITLLYFLHGVRY